MIDPTNITNYNLSESELQEHILFWVLAAGKNGVVSAQCLDTLLTKLRYEASYELEAQGYSISDAQFINPFDLIKPIDQPSLATWMMQCGIGCHSIKSKTFRDLASSGLDLKTCTTDDLEAIYGIGPKTARCFIIHSRPNQKLAGLDRHILSFLRDKGYNVPKSTPTGSKYKTIEQYFIKEAEKAGKNIAELDLEVWNHYRDK